MPPECIFCRIVRGEIPAVRVYEDADTLAFMDIGPIVKGHVLVIPKTHHDPLTAAPPETLHAVIATVQRIAAAQMSALGAAGVNVHQANGAAAGQVVPEISSAGVAHDDQIAKVSIVGVGMSSHSGIAARAFSALAKQGVDIQMISTSEIKISVLVPTAQADAAVVALHEEFKLDVAPEVRRG